MSPAKKEDVSKVKKEEEIELDEIVTQSIEDGELGEGGQYFELRLDETVTPVGIYDFVVFIPNHNPGYPIGTAAARAYSALNDGGKFIIDFSGDFYDPKAISAQISFLSFELIEERDGKVVFQK